MLHCKLCLYQAETLSDLRKHFLAVHFTDVNADYVRRQEVSSDEDLVSAGLYAGLVIMLANDPLEDWKGSFGVNLPETVEGKGGEAGGAGASGDFQPEPATIETIEPAIVETVIDSPATVETVIDSPATVETSNDDSSSDGDSGDSSSDSSSDSSND